MLDAQARHRELTQEIFNIGDEVATSIENLAEAVADWDAELVEDCLAELADIVEEARTDARTVLRQLWGVRQALTTGRKAGTIPVETAIPTAQPTPVVVSTESLIERFPIKNTPVIVRELSHALVSRTDLVGGYLETTVEWVLNQTERCARDLDAGDLPRVYQRAHELVVSAATAWLSAVAEDHPGFTKTMRGHNPPEFLHERARIDAIVARVKVKRANAIVS